MKVFFVALLLQSSLLRFAAAASNNGPVRDDVQILMYETDPNLEHDPTSPLHFFKERGNVAAIQTTVFGGNLAYHGFGDKYQTLKALLEIIDQNKLVVVADARDVALNVPDHPTIATQAVDRFLDAYDRLTKDSPHAVVMSAEAQCCVSAMAHAHPSEYFNITTGRRNKRACASGNSDCLWYPSQNIEEWQAFMEDRSYEKHHKELLDVYLNAGLMAGHPQDLIRLLDVMDVEPYEDDQAVLSGLMYSFPDMIVLDYEQEMFGNTQWTRGLPDGCIFESQGPASPLIHSITGTEPLILHTPGKFYSCLDILIESLGGVSLKRYSEVTK